MPRSRASTASCRELPSGVQLFSLLRANPKLLRLVADIMGTAPRLSRILSRRRRVLDAVLDPRVLGDLPRHEEIAALIAAEMDGATDFQDALDRARVIGNEQAFLIGVRVLTGMISAPLAGSAYAQLAEELIGAVQRAVESAISRCSTARCRAAPPPSSQWASSAGAR